MLPKFSLSRNFKNLIYFTPAFNSTKPKTDTVVGIDLGTHVSYISILEGSLPKVIPADKGKTGYPSILGLDKEGNWLAGEQIKDNENKLSPENILYSTKRLMGRHFEEPSIQTDAKHLLYKIVAGKTGDAAIELGGKQYSPEFIHALLLKRLKKKAEDHLKKPIEESVMTVPGYFHDQQRKAIKNAGRIAGMNVLKLMNESTAAAMAYTHINNFESKTFAIYNLGGGHFDVSIFEWNYGVLDVKAVTSRASLGIDDINILIQHWIIEALKTDLNVDISKDKSILWKLRGSIESAVNELSQKEEADIRVHAQGKEYSYPLTRSKLEELIEKLMGRAAETCERSLQDSGIEKSAIEEVLLIGEMTNVDKVYKIIQQVFGKTPRQIPSQEHMIAYGAAIEAGILTGAIKDKLVLDVTPHTLSMESPKGEPSLLIHRNTVIPAQKDIVVSDPAGVKNLSFKLYQGENQTMSKNRFVGEFEIPEIPNNPKQVEVSFLIDSSGVLNVTAHEPGNKEQEFLVKRKSGGLTEEDIFKLQNELKSL